MSQIRFDEGSVWVRRDFARSLRDSSGALNQNNVASAVLYFVHGSTDSNENRIILKAINIADPDIISRTTSLDRDSLEAFYNWTGKHTDPSKPAEQAVAQMRKAARDMLMAEGKPGSSGELGSRVLREFFPTLDTDVISERHIRLMSRLASKADNPDIWTDQVKKTFFGNFFDDLKILHNASEPDVTGNILSRIVSKVRDKPGQGGVLSILNELETVGIDPAPFEKQLNHALDQTRFSATLANINGVTKSINAAVNNRISTIASSGRDSQMRYLDALNLQLQHLKTIRDRGLDGETTKIVSGKIAEVENRVNRVSVMMRQLTLSDQTELETLKALRTNVASIEDISRDMITGPKTPGRAILQKMYMEELPGHLRDSLAIGKPMTLRQAEALAVRAASKIGSHVDTLRPGDIVDYTGVTGDVKFERPSTMVYTSDKSGMPILREIGANESGFLSPVMRETPAEQMLARQRAVWLARGGRQVPFDAYFFQPGKDASPWVKGQVAIRAMSGGKPKELTLDILDIQGGGKREIFVSYPDEPFAPRSLKDTLEMHNIRVNGKQTKAFHRAYEQIARMHPRRQLLPRGVTGTVESMMELGSTPTYYVPAFIRKAMGETEGFRFIETPQQLENAVGLLKRLADGQMSSLPGAAGRSDLIEKSIQSLRTGISATVEDAIMRRDLKMITPQAAIDLVGMMNDKRKLVKKPMPMIGSIYLDKKTGAIRAYLPQEKVSVIMSGTQREVNEAAAGEFLLGLIRKRKVPNTSQTPPLGPGSPYRAGWKFLTRRTRHKRAFINLNDEILRGSEKGALALRTKMYEVQMQGGLRDAFGINSIIPIWERPIDRKLGTWRRPIEGFRELDQNIIERIFKMPAADDVARDIRTIGRVSGVEELKKVTGRRVGELLAQFSNQEIAAKKIAEAVMQETSASRNQVVAGLLKARHIIAKKQSVDIAMEKAAGVIGRYGSAIIGMDERVQSMAKHLDKLSGSKTTKAKWPKVHPVPLNRFFGPGSDDNISTVLRKLNYLASNFPERIKDPAGAYWINPSWKKTYKLARDLDLGTLDIVDGEMSRMLGFANTNEMIEHSAQSMNRLRGITPEMKMVMIDPTKKEELRILRKMAMSDIQYKLKGSGIEALWSFSWAGKQYGIPMTNKAALQESLRVIREDMVEIPMLRQMEMRTGLDLTTQYNNKISKGQSPRKALANVVSQRAILDSGTADAFAYMMPDSPFRVVSDDLLRAKRVVDQVTLGRLGGVAPTEANIGELMDPRFKEQTGKAAGGKAAASVGGREFVTRGHFQHQMRILHRAHSYEVLAGRPGGTGRLLRFTLGAEDKNAARSMLIPFGRFAGNRIDEVHVNDLLTIRDMISRDYTMKNGVTVPKENWVGFSRAIDDYVLNELKGGVGPQGKIRKDINIIDHIKSGAEEASILDKNAATNAARNAVKKSQSVTGFIQRNALLGIGVLLGGYAFSKFTSDPLKEQRVSSDQWKSIHNNDDSQVYYPTAENVHVKWEDSDLLNKRLMVNINARTPSDMDMDDVTMQLKEAVQDVVPFSFDTSGAPAFSQPDRVFGAFEMSHILGIAQSNYGPGARRVF